MLAEDLIECHGVKVFSRPRVLGGKQLVEAKEQVVHIIKLAIAWDGSTRYLAILPPTKVDVATLSSLEITSGEPYLPYSPFGKTTCQFRLSEPCTSLDRVKYAWTNERITEWR